MTILKIEKQLKDIDTVAETYENARNLYQETYRGNTEYTTLYVLEKIRRTLETLTELDLPADVAEELDDNVDRVEAKRLEEGGLTSDRDRPSYWIRSVPAKRSRPFG